jgi:hypothetical protein
MAKSRGQSDIQGLLASKAMDQVADYARRGRRHEKLSLNKLTDQWRAAFAAMADRPHDAKANAIQNDLSSEFSKVSSRPRA